MFWHDCTDLYMYLCDMTLCQCHLTPLGRELLFKILSISNLAVMRYVPDTVLAVWTVTLTLMMQPKNWLWWWHTLGSYTTIVWKIQIQHNRKELWHGHRFWLCVHRDLDDMTLGQSHDKPLGLGQQLCEGHQSLVRCFTSKATILQSFAWWHIDVQATWRLDLLSGSLARHLEDSFYVPGQTQKQDHLFTVLLRLDPSLLQWVKITKHICQGHSLTTLNTCIRYYLYVVYSFPHVQYLIWTKIGISVTLKQTDKNSIYKTTDPLESLHHTNTFSNWSKCNVSNTFFHKIICHNRIGLTM